MGWKYLGNMNGAGPLYKRVGKAAAGSTETFNIGDMVKFDTTKITKVTAAADYDKALGIVAEKQEVGDVARYLVLLIPKKGDVFECALDAEAALKYGQKIEIVDHETVKSCAGGTTYIGKVCGDDQYLRDSTTVVSKATVQVELEDQTGKAFSD